jgi:hypothetical protein
VTGPKSTTVKKDGCEEKYGATQLTMVKGDVTEIYKTGHETDVENAARDEFFLAGQATTVNAELTDQEFHSSHMRSVKDPTKNTHTGSLKRHATGNVILSYSSLSRMWGVTTRKNKSLYWTVTNTTEIICANQNLTAPKGLWAKLGSKESYRFHMYAGLLHVWVGVAKTQAYGMWLSIARKEKLEGFGLFINIMGVWAKTHANHIDMPLAIRHKMGGLTGHH